MFKKLALLCIASAMILSTTGCIGKNDSHDTNSITESVASNKIEDERVIAEAQEYLAENYPDDDFTFLGGQSPSWSYCYYELSFTSKKYDGQSIIVYGDPRRDEDPNSVVTSYYKDDDGNVIYDYYDNYYVYSMKDEAEKYFYDLSNKYISDNVEVTIVLYDGIGFACKVDNKRNFIENAKEDQIRFNVHLKIDGNVSSSSLDVQNMLEEIKNNSINTDISFRYKTSSEDDYSGFFQYKIDNGEIKEKYRNDWNE